MKIIIALAMISAPVAAKQPIDLLPKNFAVLPLSAVAGRAASGCSLDQGDEVMLFRVDGRDYAAARKTFAATYREAGSDIDTTMIALDAGRELCRIG